MSTDKSADFKWADIATLAADVTSKEGPGEFAKQFNQRIIETFRATGGRLSGELRDGPIALITMTGSKSGKERIVPLGVIETEGRRFIIASRGGTDDNPVWYNSIIANPLVTVERFSEKYRAKAVPLQGAERDRIFEVATQQAPDFGNYQKRTQRIIPVLELVPVS
jgi:deazaflavin-dependent oxidoreductase (nitroreductase family)